MPSVIPAERMLVPKCSPCTNSTTPNSPYTIEGTPARFLIATRIKRVIFVSFAYSFKYIATQQPRGSASTVVIIVTRNVPAIAGKIPPCVIPSFGMPVRNSSVTLPAPLLTIS
jgi:hypothetical protein